MVETSRRGDGTARRTPEMPVFPVSGGNVRAPPRNGRSPRASYSPTVFVMAIVRCWTLTQMLWTASGNSCGLGVRWTTTAAYGFRWLLGTGTTGDKKRCAAESENSSAISRTTRDVRKYSLLYGKDGEHDCTNNDGSDNHGRLARDPQRTVPPNARSSRRHCAHPTFYHTCVLIS